MTYRRKRRSAWFAAAGVVSALVLGLPGTASATECSKPEAPDPPVAGSVVSENPPGETAVQTCSPFTLREIGRRH
jgi:hypothetical protein